MVKFKVNLLFLSFVIATAHSAKILAVFPIGSISHQVVFRPITQELVRRGHEVTVITPDPINSKDPALKNLTEIDVHNISYEGIWKFNEDCAIKRYDRFQSLTAFIKYVTKSFEKILKTEKVSALMKRKSDYFDLLIIENLSRPAYIFTHFFKAPTIVISSAGINSLFEDLGVPYHYILYPDTTRSKINNLTMWDKVVQVYSSYRLRKVWSDGEEDINKMLSRVVGSNVLQFRELSRNIDMLFMNIHSIWDTNRPIPPNIIYLGGLHQQPQKALPKDLQQYLDESKNGVIYISFGTNYKPSWLSPDKIRTIINVFSKLPYNVLWKWDNDVLPGQTVNIKIGKWFPQADLLRHKNIKLFITQGGLQSTDEAITAGVPMLGIPIFGDQNYNVEKYVDLKIGKRLHMKTLTEEDFKNAIESIINDDSYRQNIQDVRNKMYDKPMSSLDTAMWWIEYVLRHKGAKHLRAPSAGMTWAEYLELPVILTLLAIIFSFVVVITVCFVYVFRRMLNKSKVKRS